MTKLNPNQIPYTLDQAEVAEPKVHLSRRGKAILALAGVAVTGGLVAGVDAITPDYKLSGSQQVLIDEDTKTEWQVAKNIKDVNNIDIREAIMATRNDPANIDVFNNGQLDPGEVVVVAKEVVKE